MSVSDRECAKLRRILEVARNMAATTDLSVLLRTVIDAACEVLECERATIFLYDAGTDELFSRVATGDEEIRFPASRGIAGSAAQERTVINVPDAYADDRFNPDIDRKTGFRTRNLLTFALENLEGELVGVLQAVNKRSGPFDADDQELADILRAQAGVALHRHHLLEEFVDKQRMQRDLELARSIQQALFPKEPPCVAGYDIAGWNRPADETGGDCYDFVALPDGRTAVLLADATGHGIGAALVIAQFRSLVRAMLSVTTDLRSILNRVNQLLTADLKAGRFVTAFVGLLDAEQHQMEYVAAGQGPLLFAGGGTVESRNATNVPLGVMDDADYEPQHYRFTNGDALILLTDGFFEAANATGDQFSEQRVTELITSHDTAAPHELIASIEQAVTGHASEVPQADDLTAVIVKRS